MESLNIIDTDYDGTCRDAFESDIDGLACILIDRNLEILPITNAVIINAFSVDGLKISAVSLGDKKAESTSILSSIYISTQCQSG